MGCTCVREESSAAAEGTSSLHTYAAWMPQIVQRFSCCLSQSDTINVHVWIFKFKSVRMRLISVTFCLIFGTGDLKTSATNMKCN